jgi:glycosyltransferase involved in cell wall biosynthesis
MGPGAFEGYTADEPSNTRTIVLIGGASHKENERAAELLARSAVVRRGYKVIGVSLSEHAKQTLVAANLADGQLALFDRPLNDELAAIYREASAFLHLGVSEGFGLPYVEAAYFGCDVVASCTHLTRQIVGPDGILVPPDRFDVHALESALESWEPARVARLQRSAHARSWKELGPIVAKLVAEGSERS